MRAFLPASLALLASAITHGAPMSGVAPFVGRWKYANEDSWSLPRVEIKLNRQDCTLQIWYISTLQMYVPWEQTKIHFYQVRGKPNQYEGVAKWKHDFGSEIVILRLRKNQLVLDFYMDFDDVRPDERSSYSYNRSRDKSFWSTEAP